MVSSSARLGKAAAYTSDKARLGGLRDRVVVLPACPRRDIHLQRVDTGLRTVTEALRSRRPRHKSPRKKQFASGQLASYRSIRPENFALRILRGARTVLPACPRRDIHLQRVDTGLRTVTEALRSRRPRHKSPRKKQFASGQLASYRSIRPENFALRILRGARADSGGDSSVTKRLLPISDPAYGCCLIKIKEHFLRSSHPTTLRWQENHSFFMMASLRVKERNAIHRAPCWYRRAGWEDDTADEWPRLGGKTRGISASFLQSADCEIFRKTRNKHGQ
uniref:Uncharacterized protein n=1 Tax=Branchiostoma floridae TaxID=7739 RepID=C3ZCZ2_BRAFL|eukprot:XP_002593634.1 hypothetical protein BRAFLDRAFT_98756 [Branchiostoma floridae]